MTPTTAALCCPHSEWRMRRGRVGAAYRGTIAAAAAPMAPPPSFDPTAHRVHDRASRSPEPSNWRRYGPYLRTLAVAIVLTAAAASAGMLMALMGA